MELYQLLGKTEDELQDLIRNKKRYYVSYKILKSNKSVRWIRAPQEPLKSIQRQILHKILYRFTASSIAHGFVRERNPKSHAEKHIGKKTLVTLDLKDFFPSITQRRVRGLLKIILPRHPDLTVTPIMVDQLSELLTYDGKLPQGAPTSPTVSNLICLNFDKKLTELQDEHSCTITRYADDIAVSFDHRGIRDVILSLTKCILESGFRINYRKFKVRRAHKRQKITGVLVNEKTNAPKRLRKNLRAQIHNYKINNKNLELNSKEYLELRGRVEWIKSLNEAAGSKLLSQLSEITVRGQ